ncbi:unnamed protein product [Urochloa decumbens]|uniref:Uncharacterized protein n=1 Tax=Urochloa decumbens TaxID=240449 RepID=A0ABC9G9E7_9POAL
MSGQRPPSPQPQPFRFWLPYRSNVGMWRQQPRPSSPPMPSSPRPHPPTPPSPTPAGPPPQRPAPHAVVEDIPLQAESSDESDTIPVRSSGSSQLRGRTGSDRPSAADLELTLSGAPPPAGQEQSSGRVGGGNRGGDTKIAISGFPRSRLFDGARAPYRREIEDGLKSLTARETPAPAPTRPEQGYRIVTLAGHNVGASMVLGGAPPAGQGAAETPEAPAGSKAPAPRVAANVNSNVQSVNNSSMEGSTLSAGSPGVHVDVKNAPEEPAAATPKGEDKRKKEPVRRPPLIVTPREKSPAAAAGGGDSARRRRCLRALMMESGSDTEAARKPRPGACRFQCVADHAPPAATAGNGNGAGGRSAEDGGKSRTEEATS